MTNRLATSEEKILWRSHELVTNNRKTLGKKRSVPSDKMKEDPPVDSKGPQPRTHAIGVGDKPRIILQNILVLRTKCHRRTLEEKKGICGRHFAGLGKAWRSDLHQ